VTCRLSLTIDGLTKEVVQQEGGRQSRELRELADEVLAFCEEPSRQGLGADDLEQGLRRVAEGKLAPETLSLMVHQRPSPESPSSGLGWLLRVQGRKASTRLFVPGEGYHDPVATVLSGPELGELALRLGRQNVSDLPGNLWADVYTDFTVRVLNHEKRIQARRFAGMEPDTHGERQQRFDRICQDLLRLHSRVLKAQ
jgi:hypothetical protein